jgi:hypothetical protein
LITIYLTEENNHQNKDNTHTVNDDEDDDVCIDDDMEEYDVINDGYHLPMMFTAMSSIPVTSLRLA